MYIHFVLEILSALYIHPGHSAIIIDQHSFLCLLNSIFIWGISMQPGLFNLHSTEFREKRRFSFLVFNHTGPFPPTTTFFLIRRSHAYIHLLENRQIQMCGVFKFNNPAKLFLILKYILTQVSQSEQVNKLGKRNCAAEIASHAKTKLCRTRPNFIYYCEAMRHNFFKQHTKMCRI